MADDSRKNLVKEVDTVKDPDTASAAEMDPPGYETGQSLSSCPLQEHEPLHHLLYILPQKAMKGLFSFDIVYTCIDVSKEYIALSTNVGLIFLYDRLSQTLQKLKSPIRGEALTCVKMRQSVDYVVAVGSENGRVYVFQLPSILPGRAKQMYCVEELHVGKITCLEWSPNTEKLFSGDQDGNVICTEIDYERNQSKSFSVCQEPHPVVQLNYAHRTLLVSTTFRTVLWSNDATGKVRKVGTKDRKVLGEYGGCFMPGSYKPEDAVLYASRPGLRLWRADITGKVLTTFMYRDLLHGKTPVIPVLPETICEQAAGIIEEVNFGPLSVFNNQHLVTWTKGTLLLLDPCEGKLLGWINNLGKLRSVSVCADEVYILRDDNPRFIIRIATQKDRLNEPGTVTPEPLTPQKLLSGSTTTIPNTPVHLFQHTADIMSSGIKAAFQGVTDRIQEGQQIAGGGSIPPWGFASGSSQKSVDDQDVDSCKEVSSASSVSSSVDLGSPSNAPSTSVGSPAKGHEQKVAQTPTSERLPESSSDYMMKGGKNSTKHQPEIHLESDDVISVHIPQDTSSLVLHNEQTRDTQTLEVSQEPKTSPVPERKNVLERLNNITDLASDDIVFSPKPKKQKKKKGRLGASKTLADDTLSIDSLEVASFDSSHEQHIKHESPSVTPDISKSVCGKIEIEQNTEIVLKTTVNDMKGSPSESQSDCKPDLQSNSGTSLSPDSLQTQEYLPRAESPLPPVQDLGDTLSGKLNLEDQDTSLSVLSDIEASPGAVVPGKTGENHAKRPQDLPAMSVVSSNKIYSTDSGPIFIGRRASSPLNFVPLKPERSASVPSPPELNTSLTSASSISASYHEDMNQASFETYARQNSERSKSETPSPSLENPQSFYKTPDSSDDFYSKYQKDASCYSLDDIYSPTHGNSIEDALDYSNVKDSELATYSSSEKDKSKKSPSTTGARPKNLVLVDAETDATDVMYQFSDTWTEMLAPGNLQSMCITDRHIWVVDKSDRLHYSSLSGPGLTWRKVDEPARQISVSRSGSIVWRLHQGSVYAGTKITTRAPAGLNWVEVLRKEVAHISVDDTVAWYIKHNGDVMMQKGLSRDRPSFRSIKVKSRLKLKQITCRNGVVWGITDSQSLYVRKGITSSQEEGKTWENLGGGSTKLKVSSCALGDDGTAWVIDLSCKVWFTTDVTCENPMGSGKWWEVSISEYMMNSDSAMSIAMKPLAEFPLTRLVAPASEKGGLVTVGQGGVWVSQGFRHVLSICRGSLMGHRWEVTGPTGMASSAKWIHVSSCAATKSSGLIWAQQPNGAIFAFSPSLTGKVIEVSPPRPEMAPFRCMSANLDSVWALTNAGQVIVRSGMASHCPHGLNWVILDLVQLGAVKLVHLACGSQNIWAIDSKGMIYQRIGNQPPDTSHLNPAWVPVEGGTHQTGAKFTKVYTGALDWMVWAVDSKKCVYVRVGVTDSMPIGTHWLYVPGTHVDDLTISERLVYSLNPNGEILVRYGILEENPAGDYWKKIPGKLSSVSVTATDNLWGINLEGQLCLRTTNFLKRKELESVYTPTRVNVAISDDWEVI